MGVFLIIEASQSRGKTYRLGWGTSQEVPFLVGLPAAPPWFTSRAAVAFARKGR